MPVSSGSEMAASIIRLPNELLCEVFLYLRDNIHSQATAPGQRGGRPHRWVVVSHVCQRWREVAIRLPRLWIHIIVTHSTERISAFLQRAGDSLLTFRQGYITVRDQDYAKLVYQHLHRTASVRNLNILDDVYLSHLPPSTLSGELPLRFLSIRTNPAIESLAALSTAALPHLRALDMTDVHNRALQHFLRPTLTSLVLSYIHPPHSVAQWVSLLRSMPCLEILILADAVSTLDGPADVLPPSRRAQLVRLRSLDLVCVRTDFESAIVGLARNLFAPNASLHLVGKSFNAQIPAMQALARAVAQKAEAVKCRCNGIHREGSVAFIDHKADATLTIWAKLDDFDAFLLGFFDGLSFPEVRRIEGERLILNAALFRIIASTVPHVAQLQLGRAESVRGLVEALEQSLDEGVQGSEAAQGVGGQRRPLLADLETLNLDYINWDEEYFGRSTPWKAPLFERLEAVLRRRRDQGTTLRSLRLKKSAHVGYASPDAALTDLVEDFQLSEKTCPKKDCACRVDLGRLGIDIYV